EQRGQRDVVGTRPDGKSRLGAAGIEMGAAGNGLAGHRPADRGEIDARGLLGDIGVKTERNAGGGGRCLEAEQHEGEARVPARERCLAVEIRAAVLHRALARSVSFMVAVSSEALPANFVLGTPST